VSDWQALTVTYIINNQPILVQQHRVEIFFGKSICMHFIIYMIVHGCKVVVWRPVYTTQSKSLTTLVDNAVTIASHKVLPEMKSNLTLLCCFFHCFVAVFCKHGNQVLKFGALNQAIHEDQTF